MLRIVFTQLDTICVDMMRVANYIPLHQQPTGDTSR